MSSSGGPPSHKRCPLWGAVIRVAASLVPAGTLMRVCFDDTTKKKAGTHSEGIARYCHGASSARQAYRTLRGVNFVSGVRHVPRTRWPATASVCRLVSHSLAKNRKPTSFTSRIGLAASWPGISSISSPSSCLTQRSSRLKQALPSKPAAPAARHPAPLPAAGRAGGPLAYRGGGGGLPGARGGHGRAAGRHRRVCREKWPREKWLYISYTRTGDIATYRTTDHADHPTDDPVPMLLLP
jgi:hypothetical protein